MARHFGLVFHLYFSFILSGPCFSVSILVRICCSLLLLNSHLLLIIYSLMQLVMVSKIFLFIFFFLRLCSRNITLVFCLVYLNSNAIFICIGILTLSFQTGYLVLFYTHRFSHLLLLNCGILALFLYTLVF